MNTKQIIIFTGYDPHGHWLVWHSIHSDLQNGR